MDFMSIGSSEILMIILVAVLVVGPNRIVGIARTMGNIMRTIRKTTAELTTSVSKEIELEEKEKQSSLDSEKKEQIPDNETSKS
jgi:sec-independent protein translocase protein TatB